ncbi:phosphate signaling complex protein PhoU [Psychrobacter sp. AOP22-C1-22]|uniref:phosphate signaling complex protein PhoU n=1 Tax=unclassified Psychrobacter TaxID=196806 RepID=UPI0017878952|nr:MULTISPECIES: phosphate signaling complex protein PhoU [unclassified Psychrobacter]MBE0407314.1 phosphate signaling complex protein PhoU [Psychrobacter sp. FME6]MBE0445498.1 phosphate signaling complex protein PhoU [Psychrobacter sp. FME5]MDN5801880.1 phosphate signaling complex protein PhoU [Psychrobacter sp.]
MLITQKHLSKSFDNELHEVVDLFMQMGRMAAEQVMVATRALIAADEVTAKKVIADDDLINQLEIKIDEQIILLVAKRQPTANDLRLVMALSKGIVDFERVGDEAEKIARMACQLLEDGVSPKGCSEVQHLSNQVRLMLLNAIEAFSYMNTQQAFSVLQSDTAVDEEYQSATRSLMTYIMEDNRHVSKVINILWVLRALERVGDHARNIAELVIFCTSGKDVRHADFMHIKQIVQQTINAAENPKN